MGNGKASRHNQVKQNSGVRHVCSPGDRSASIRGLRHPLLGVASLSRVRREQEHVLHVLSGVCERKQYRGGGGGATVANQHAEAQWRTHSANMHMQ